MQRTLIWHTPSLASFFFFPSPFSSWCLTLLESDTRFTSGQRHSSSSFLHLSRGLFFKRMPFVVQAGGQGVKEEEESSTLPSLHRFQFIRSKHFQDQKALILSVWTAGNNEGRVRDHSVPLLALISSYHAAKIGACLNISGSQKSYNDLTAQTHKWVPFYEELEDKKKN